MYTVLLPTGVNPIAVKKNQISYYIIYHIMYHIISYIISLKTCILLTFLLHYGPSYTQYCSFFFQ